MALVDIGQWHIPAINVLIGISTSSSYQINGTGYRIGYVFPIWKTGNIAKVSMRIAACASAQLSRLGIYSVTSGEPTTSGQYKTFTPAVNTDSGLLTLDTPVAVTLGEWRAIVLEFDSTAGDCYISPWSVGYYANQPALGYFTKYNGSSWTKVAFGAVPVCGVVYDDDTLAPFSGFPWTTLGTTISTYNASSSPDEYGIKMTFPFACRIAGMWHMVTVQGANRGHDVRLYNDTTQLHSLSLTSVDYTGGGQVCTIPFTTKYTVAAGDTRIASVKATGTSNLTYYTAPLVNTKGTTAFGSGVYHSVSRVDTDAWTNDTSVQPRMGFVIDQLDNGVATTPAAARTIIQNIGTY